MKGYKAFKKGMICEDKQYKENTIVCQSGMHFCKNPLDVLDYYPLVDSDGNMSEFAKVEALDECKTDDNKKYCTKKLKIGAKIGFPALVQASINLELEKVPTDETEVKTASGNYVRIGSSGNYARIGSSGNYAQIGSSGNLARIGSSGDSVQIGSSGNSTQIGSSGDSAKIESTGNYSVIFCAGDNSIAKAKIGSWITLSEWKYDKKKGVNIPICVKTEYVDGKKIKADTFYRLENGKFVEYKV